MNDFNIEPQLVYVFQPLELAALLAKAAKATKEEANPKPRLLGWRIMLDEFTPSAQNSPCRGATREVNHKRLFNGDRDANWLFPTRAAARAAIADSECVIGGKVVPVYE